MKIWKMAFFFDGAELEPVPLSWWISALSLNYSPLSFIVFSFDVKFCFVVPDGLELIK